MIRFKSIIIPNLFTNRVLFIYDMVYHTSSTLYLIRVVIMKIIVDYTNRIYVYIHYDLPYLSYIVSDTCCDHVDYRCKMPRDTLTS